MTNSQPASEDVLRAILEKLPLNSLNEILKCNNEEAKEKTVPAVDLVLDAAYDTGIQEFVKKLNDSDCKNLLKDLNASVSSQRAQLEESLFTQFEDIGLDDIFVKVGTRTLQAISKRIGYDTSSTSKKNLPSGMAKQVMMLGAKELLSKLSLSALKQIAKDLSVSSAGKKDVVIGSILSVEFDTEASEIVAAPKKKTRATSKKTTKKTTKKTASKKKSTTTTTKKRKKAAPAKPKVSYPTKDEILEMRKDTPIEAGITKEQLHNFYWVGELKDYCKDNGIKCSGKKSELMNRIIRFLETGEKVTGKRKRGASTTKSNKKQKTE